ncbi:hypothetical protein BDBG_16060 [Blastomyces gilchristii SLH14081]|uniref:Uncharacterized protein n=1 Tax=Blastomyces gilchristii (strain SLH14081) TaxID=559298 RepID=A0A179U8H8_BLAGS|nr:uncharacterized protein BDBG_16060 [Blastomyces gilchristii SLH14081]OAT03457.1 hypothetical protein BDBG_16060 [Blastomyces gilchristii SLH14081]
MDLSVDVVMRTCGRTSYILVTEVPTYQPHKASPSTSSVNIHLLSLFVPLVRKGMTKKVVTLTSGGADIEFISRYEITSQMPYAVSKAAMNAATGEVQRAVSE